MDASLIWENPGLTLLGILAGIFLILLPLIISAARRSRERSEAVALRDREPSIYGSLSDDRSYDEQADVGRYAGAYDDDVPNDRWSPRESQTGRTGASVFESGQRSRESASSLATSRRSGSARIVWFLVGIGVGAGGLAIWLNPPPSDALASVLALLDRPAPPTTTAEETPQPDSSEATDRFGEAAPEGFAQPSAISDGDTTEVGEMVESFILTLRDQLPMAVGPGITMVNADFEGNIIALGFMIAQTVADEDAPKLQEELETRFQKSVCATAPDPTNIHGLNERGVSFIITYVDLIGKNVAGLSVAPNFCSDPA